MKASSESGECASLISKVCWTVLEVAVVPDIFRILFLYRCFRGAADVSERPRGGELSPDDGGSHNGTSGGEGAIWKRRERSFTALGLASYGRG